MTTIVPGQTPTTSNIKRAIGYTGTGTKERLETIWEYRNLIANLSKREIKSRHKNSILGFAWNLFTPLLQMTIYSIVFGYFMPRGAPSFPLKLLTGMAIYGLFADSLQSATTSVVGNASLVTKIWFPREILPVTAVVSNLVTFASRLIILAVALIAYWHPPEWTMLWLAIPAIAITIILATGAGLLLAALNVFFRDVQHFLNLVLLALFWFTPVVWDYSFLAARVAATFGPGWERAIMLNPLIPLTTTFQRVLYNPSAFPVEEHARFAYLLRPTSWFVINLGIAFVTSSLVLYAGLRVFVRLEGSFAENL